MGMVGSAIVGPYIEVPIIEENVPVKRRLCINSQCTRHNDPVILSVIFCASCGEKIAEVLVDQLKEINSRAYFEYEDDSDLHDNSSKNVLYDQTMYFSIDMERGIVSENEIDLNKAMLQLEAFKKKHATLIKTIEERTKHIVLVHYGIIVNWS